MRKFMLINKNVVASLRFMGYRILFVLAIPFLALLVLIPYCGLSEAVDLDSGDASSYSAAKDTNPSAQTTSDYTCVNCIESVKSAIIAIQDALGLVPEGSMADVDTRLDVEHGEDGEHTNYFRTCFESVDITTGQSAIVVPLLGVDRWITGSTTWDPSSITSDGTMFEAKDITVTGAVLGDMADCSITTDISDLDLDCNVTAANTVTGVLANNTGAAVDLTSFTIKAKVLTNGSTYTANEMEWPNAGSITAVSIQTDTIITSGSVYGDPTINGAAITLQAQADTTNTQHHSTTQAKDTDAFSANDRLGVKLTSSANLAPVTDLSATICVEYTYND